ncbi:hypothetical protein GE061_007442 [Apolygus lucorum]|uniref:Uncharacterized protein n=1 Tax=Apolygus lucorum TaxID=248454 RepID=A0A8S9WUB1_APOLU|nr:hypothetical protein GE061_007442 [Apolygus lucorum]
METYWEDSTLPAPVKYENHLSYNNANNSEDDEYGFPGSKKKLTRITCFRASREFSTEANRLMGGPHHIAGRLTRV